jgi:hypothetical protein
MLRRPWDGPALSSRLVGTAIIYLQLCYSVRGIEQTVSLGTMIQLVIKLSQSISILNTDLNSERQ